MLEDSSFCQRATLAGPTDQLVLSEGVFRAVPFPVWTELCPPLVSQEVPVSVLYGSHCLSVFPLRL